jgi:hypothetical protein
MSVLTDALDRALHHRILLESRFAKIVLPGLSRDRILGMTAHLPYRIPEELIELYQWRNGTAPEGWDSFISCFEFLPLENAIDTHNGYWHFDDLVDANEESYRSGLPIMDCNGDAHLLAIFGKDSYKAPIWCMDLELGVREQCFDSLTAMSQTIAECYEEGLYWWNPESATFDRRNYKRFLQLHQKYNQYSTPLSDMYF